MLNIEQFRGLVIDPTLEELGLYSLTASKLVLGTALQESGLRHLKQLDGGPALGVCQMEPSTHDDIWESWLAYRDELAERVGRIGVNADDMVWNLKYSVAMCRVHYYRKPEPLPAVDDIQGHANYWKRHYNTIRGRGTVQDYMNNWLRHTRAA